MFWYTTILLALEATSVINTRLARMATGDLSETQRMFTEKVGAAFDACSIVAGGGDAAKVIECYRKHVAENAQRLREND
jgi:hypothetical protein